MDFFPHAILQWEIVNTKQTMLYLLLQKTAKAVFKVIKLHQSSFSKNTFASYNLILPESIAFIRLKFTELLNMYERQH